MKNCAFKPLVLAFLCVGLSCKARESSKVRDDKSGGAGQAFNCKFVFPDYTEDFFQISGKTGASGLTGVKSSYIITVNGSKVSESKSKDMAALVTKEAMIHKWDLLLEQHTSKSREVLGFEKDHFAIDHSKYSCFDISGSGLKQEDYLCFSKSMQIGNDQVLWVSNFRYEKELNVMNIMGSTCLSAN